MAGVLLVAACGESKKPAAAATSAAAAPAAPPGSAICPANGLWSVCSLRYRLERGGLVAKVDSEAKPDEKELTGAPLVLKVGRNSKLELYIYPDSTSRIADEKKLDRTQFISETALQTIKRERTLIESANVLGLLTSLDERMRERVADNIMAGPPQPTSAQPIAAQPVKP